MGVIVLIFLGVYSTQAWADSSDDVSASAQVSSDIFGESDGVYNYIDSYNYEDKGVLVYTSVEVEGKNDATIESGGTLIYTLVITNPHWDIRDIDLRFGLPVGFNYDRMVNGSSPVVSGSELRWEDYPAPAGESSISFKVIVP